MEEKLMTDDERIAEEVVVDGLTFVPFLKRDEIRRQVKRVASELRRDLEGKRPLFICVLNGAFIFAADLIRECGINDCSVTFVRYKSYEGMSTTGNVKQLVGLTEDLTGRDVVIIEDIVDTGLTAKQMIADIKKQGPASSKTGFTPDYAAFTIPPSFIIGYGLDLDGKVRNLKDIYVIKE